MKILLINVDSKIPNLALMQISSYYKSKGHEVGFNITDPDKVYISCIFKKNGSQVNGIKTMFPNAEVYVGGSGVNYNWLPKEIQKVRPDYNLYPRMDYSLGFTTRGCIRKCPFCIVPEKEGKLRRWQHPREFHNNNFSKMILLDNNILADREWFFEVTNYILNERLQWDPNQGLDIRLLDEGIAERLATMDHLKTYKFAFDNMNDEQAVLKGINVLSDSGIDVRHEVQFYVLVGFNTTPEQDKHRCRLLKRLGTNPFVMKYVNNDWTNKIAWWGNRKQAFWSFDIDELDRSKKRLINGSTNRNMGLESIY